MYAGASQADNNDGGLGGSNRCNKYSNGCSVVNGSPYKTQFTPACYRHDVCYGCVSSLHVVIITTLIIMIITVVIIILIINITITLSLPTS